MQFLIMSGTLPKVFQELHFINGKICWQPMLIAAQLLNDLGFQFPLESQSQSSALVSARRKKTIASEKEIKVNPIESSSK